MGGGGASGAVSFPDYIEASHRLILFGSVSGDPNGDELTVSIMDVMEAALDTGGNPFDGLEYTDPDVALSEAEAQLAAWETKVEGIDFDNDFQAILTQVAENVTSGLGVSSVSYEGFRGATASQASDLVTEFIEEFESGLDEATDFASLVDAIVAKLDDDGVVTETDVAQIITDAKSDAGDLAAAALAAATTAVGSVPLDDLVTAYTTRVDAAKASRKREFHAGMADINAVHSTAFIFGDALIEAESLSQIAQYRAEVEGRIYQAAVSSYGSWFSAAASTRMGGEAGNVRARDQLLQSSVQAVVQMLVNRTNYQTSFSQIYLEAFKLEIQEKLRARLANAQLQAQAIQSQTSTLANMYQFDFQQHEALSHLTAEMKRMRIVAVNEFEGANADLNEKHALWDFDVFHRGANILAAPSGMGAVLPGKPSRVSSALNGALSGAGKGAAVGGAIGGPPGAAIGAGIGSIVGGLSGLFG